MTIETRIIELAKAIGADVKLLNSKTGDITALTTTSKANIVLAINELKAYADTINTKANNKVLINDTATKTSKTVAWSPNKIDAEIVLAVNALKTTLTSGAGAALDTFKELADALGNDPNFATTIATGLGNRLRFDDAQTLTLPQQKQAWTNLGMGDLTHDYVIDYTTAKTGA